MRSDCVRMTGCGGSVAIFGVATAGFGVAAQELAGLAPVVVGKWCVNRHPEPVSDSACASNALPLSTRLHAFFVRDEGFRADMQHNQVGISIATGATL